MLATAVMALNRFGTRVIAIVLLSPKACFDSGTSEFHVPRTQTLKPLDELRDKCLILSRRFSALIDSGSVVLLKVKTWEAEGSDCLSMCTVSP